MTAVFYLFLLHLSVGLLAALLLVPHRAGERFFKLCATTAAVMTTAALGLLWRRHGLHGQPALFPHYGPLLATTLAFLLLAVILNRAWHFGWKRARDPLLRATVGVGVAALVAAARFRLELASDLTSALLLGSTTAAMVLGHYYLVVVDLPASALRRVVALLLAALLFRSVVVAGVFFFARAEGWREAALVMSGVFSPDGIFVWMRLLFGVVGPFSLVYFVWKTVEMRSTQSATGILYVLLFLVLAGELLAKHLRVFSGLPL